MTDCSPAWAELFLNDVKNSGFTVGLLGASVTQISDCKPELAAWYVALPQVAAPVDGDCVVWLAEAPHALNVPVISVGSVTHAYAGLRDVVRGNGLSVVQLFLHETAQDVVLDARVISTQRRWQQNRGLMLDHAEVMLRDWLGRLVILPEQALRSVATTSVVPHKLGGWGDVALYGVKSYPSVVLDKIVSVGAKVLKVPRGVWALCLVEERDDGVCFTPLAKPRGVVRADPFTATFAGKDWLFFEEYSVLDTNPKGVIKCAPLRADGTHGEVLPFMEKPYHLSYPQVFEENGAMLMMPESHAARKLEVLACYTDGQGKPVLVDEPVRVLMDKASVADATLWVDPENGERWLFASLSRTRLLDHAAELHVFKLGGESGWELEPHPMNPIVRDCRFARCAGRMYRDEGGRLIRPCQAHVGGVYGAEVHLMNITELSMEDYREQRVGGFAPTLGKGFNGLHHVRRLSKGRYLVDARKAWEIF